MYYTYIEIIHTYIDLDLLVIFVPERASVHSSSMVPGTVSTVLFFFFFQALRSAVRTGPLAFKHVEPGRLTVDTN
jgi:hypothetical protein